jgi:glycosyltransferase involved in cell wall biosynthesis
MTPIILLHHNEINFLQKCIKSILANTKSKYEIIIIDNNSNKNTVELLKKKFFRKYKIIFNKKDNWVYGFNLGIDSIKYSWNRIVLSDADIIFKKTKSGKCWLQYMHKQLNEFPIIGKLGISLNTHLLEKHKSLKKIMIREQRYKNSYKIGNNIIAPTDTTAAIYRKDLFITNKFKMQLGHTSLIKPYYYSCRTGKKLECIHLGWSKYLQMIKNNNIEGIDMIREKAWFFCKFNRTIEYPLLKKLGFIERNLIKSLAKFYYKPKIAILFIFIWFLYVVKNFPLNYNEIQKKNNF